MNYHRPDILTMQDKANILACALQRALQNVCEAKRWERELVTARSYSAQIARQLEYFKIV